MGPPGSPSEASTCCFTRCATCSSVRWAGCLVLAPPSSFTGSQSLRSYRPGVPPAAPPAPDDHWHVEQVLVVLVAEEALAQLGQPALSALQGAHELLPPIAQQDVLADEGLVVVEVLAGRPQAQVRVVVLARPGQLPVRAASSARRLHPPGRRRGLRDLLSLSRPTCHSFFTGPVFFARPRALSGICADGRELVSHGFALKNAFTPARISIYGQE